MTSEQQVEKQLNEEYQKFENAIYDGTISVPENIVELFKKGVMELSSHFHQILATKIKSIAEKSPKELTNHEVFLMIKVIANVPWKCLYGTDFDKATEAHIKIEKFALSYNQNVDKFQEGLKAKKTLLMSLSGNSGGRTNGMNIIR